MLLQVNNEVCSQFGVEGYPSIKVFTDATTNGYDFEGARDKAGVLKLVDEYSPPCSRLT